MYLFIEVFYWYNHFWELKVSIGTITVNVVLSFVYFLLNSLYFQHAITMSFDCLYLYNAYDIMHIQTQVHTPVMLTYGLLILPAALGFLVLSSTASLVYVVMYYKELILVCNEVKK